MRTLVLGLALIGAAVPALAHQLNVFAFVEGAEVVVEAQFSTGRIPVAGQVVVKDAAEAVVRTLDLAADGTARFPLDPTVSAGGLTIEVETSEGHADYWILTPDDIAAGAGS